METHVIYIRLVKVKAYKSLINDSSYRFLIKLNDKTGLL